MRRKTKRAFRYFFPVAMFMGCVFLFKEGSSSDVVKQTTLEIPSHKSVAVNAGAKMLKLISHNPETKAKLQVHAREAVQGDSGLILNNPTGVFENPKGDASLKSLTASYYEADKEVHFFEGVSFDHHSGLIATTDHAVLNTQTQEISGEQGVKVCHNANTITANSYEIQSSDDVINFSGKVCLNINQKNY
jgi:hypothetical protein